MIKQTAWGRFTHDVKNRGISAWLIAAVLAVFYVVLYLGAPFEEPTDFVQRFQSWIWPATEAMESFSQSLFSFFKRTDPETGEVTVLASRWTLYGFLYTLAITGGGSYVIWKYRHNRYQIVRTAVVMFIQVSFAFSIPLMLKFFGNPEYYFSYLWPLKIDYLDPRNFSYYGPVLVMYGFFASILLIPVMTVLFGKRWYCSWVCGCGGLANTFGEPWRHLSSKSNRAWQIEKVTINAVVAIAFVSTAVWFMSAVMPDSAGLGKAADSFRRWYGIIVVAILSGIVGVALYPIGGTRIWCRFACPMAGILGLIQKFGRYRIRVKRDMCISCGMCSKYCEMGIDVRQYAQSNVSFTRASCVGCGLCAEVCPRGVLRLENVWGRDPQELSVRSLIDESWKGGASQVSRRA